MPKGGPLNVVIGCLIGTMLAGTFNGSLSLYLLPVSKTFGWGRAEMPFALLISTCVMAVGYPIFGWLVDRFGAMRVIVPSMVLRAVGIMALSLMNGDKLQLYALFALFGIASVCSGYLVYTRLLIAWFREHRGLALGLALGVGNGVGGILNPQIAHFLIDQFGWRTAYVLSGLPFIVIGIPVAVLLLREAPAAADAAQRPADAQVGLTAMQALRTKTFWLLCFAVLLMSTGWEGTRAQLVAMMTDRGQSVQFAATMISVLFLANGVARFAEGVLLDRVQSPRIAIPAFVCVLIGILLIDRASGMALMVGAALVGLGSGGESSAVTYFAARYFGGKALSLVIGVIASITLLALGIGPVLLGAVYDRTGSYRLALEASELMIVISIVLVWMLGPYVYDVRRDRR